MQVKPKKSLIFSMFDTLPCMLSSPSHRKDWHKSCGRYYKKQNTRIDMTEQKKKRIGIGASVIVALLYVLLPTDLVPDIAPVVGWIDDIVVILIAVANALRLMKKK